MSESADPIVNALNRPFWDGADRGVLILPFCPKSGQAFWPPSPISPFTGDPADWAEQSPGGILLARSIYRRPFQEAFRPRLPYGVGLIALDAGPRLQAHIADPDDPAAPVAGARVRLVFAILTPGGRAVPTLIKS